MASSIESRIKNMRKHYLGAEFFVLKNGARGVAQNVNADTREVYIEWLDAPMDRSVGGEWLPNNEVRRARTAYTRALKAELAQGNARDGDPSLERIMDDINSIESLLTIERHDLGMTSTQHMSLVLLHIRIAKRQLRLTRESIARNA